MSGPAEVFARHADGHLARYGKSVLPDLRRAVRSHQRLPGGIIVRAAAGATISVCRDIISKRDVLAGTDTHVAFRYKATRTGRRTVTTLAAHGFRRRFLQHVMPRGFHRARCHGLWSAPSRTKLRRLAPAPGARVPAPEPDDPDRADDDPPATRPIHAAPDLREPMAAGMIPSEAPVERTNLRSRVRGGFVQPESLTPASRRKDSYSFNSRSGADSESSGRSGGHTCADLLHWP